jgi:hypothetical protein
MVGTRTALRSIFVRHVEPYVAIVRWIPQKKYALQLRVRLGSLLIFLLMFASALFKRNAMFGTVFRIRLRFRFWLRIRVAVVSTIIRRKITVVRTLPAVAVFIAGVTTIILIILIILIIFPAVITVVIITVSIAARIIIRTIAGIAIIGTFFVLRLFFIFFELRTEPRRLAVRSLPEQRLGMPERIGYARLRLPREASCQRRRTGRIVLDLDRRCAIPDTRHSISIFTDGKIY